jgi:hypothetical protein
VFYQIGKDSATTFGTGTLFEMAEKEASIPPLPWQRVPQRGKGRRRDPLTQEAIVGAAIRVLDRDGLGGFSMRRVAEQLDTGAASSTGTSARRTACSTW